MLSCTGCQPRLKSGTSPVSTIWEMTCSAFSAEVRGAFWFPSAPLAEEMLCTYPDVGSLPPGARSSATSIMPPSSGSRTQFTAISSSPSPAGMGGSGSMRNCWQGCSLPTCSSTIATVTGESLSSPAA